MRKVLKGFFSILAISLLFGCSKNNQSSEETPMDDIKIIKITNTDDFQRIENDKNNKYILESNLDFNGQKINPIGSIDNPFKGEFDGNNHTISNFSIDNENNALFGYVTGSINNTRINNTQSISRESSLYVSQLVAVLDGGYISNCFSNGSLTIENTSLMDTTFAGGIVAKNDCGIVDHCQSNTNISVRSVASNFVGGIVGYNGEGASQDAKVIYCIGKTSILSAEASYERASSYVGGVVGYNFGLVDKCISYEQKITSKTSDYFAFAGGVVADNNGGFVSHCFSSSEINTISDTSSTFLGGVMGRNFVSTQDINSGCYENCYSSEDQKITHSIPSTKEEVTNHDRVVVTMVGKDILSSPSWYKEVLGLDDQFLIKEGYYPSLNSEFKKVEFTETLGSPSNPIQITTASELLNMDSDKSYILMNDISLSGMNVYPIGTAIKPYRGVFDGNNHQITNISFSTNRMFNSLFGYVNGIIKNLKTTYSASFTASSNTLQYVSGIASFAIKSIISRCSSSLDVNVNTNGLISGGVVGYLDSSELLYSYSLGTMNVNSSTRSAFYGGLVGESYRSKIYSCYSKVSLSSKDVNYAIIGGLVGKSEGTISSCYSVPNITVTNIGTTVNVGGLVGFSKSGLIKNSYTDANIVSSSGLSSEQIGGISGINNGDIQNVLYHVNDSIKYSCGHSPVEVDVKRMTVSELQESASILGDDFYNVSGETPHLVFEREGN